MAGAKAPAAKVMGRNVPQDGKQVLNPLSRRF